MKTKYWILLLGAVTVICAALSIWLLAPGESATRAQIWSDGQYQFTVDLLVDQTLTVEGQNGTNVLAVRKGQIAVIQADCPDHYCMARGFCGSGPQIVCLPNRLVITFLGEQDVDMVVG